MAELNPDSPVLQAMRAQWQKLLAVVMDKYHLDEVRITIQDMQKLTDRFPGDVPAIVVRERDNCILLQIMPQSRGERLAASDRQERSKKAN